MCRSDLGPCCAQDCPNRVTCQDNFGYCNDHALKIEFCECDDDEPCTCPPAPPAPVDDPSRRRAYTIQQYEKMVDIERGRLALAEHRVATGEQTLAILRAEQAAEEQSP